MKILSEVKLMREGRLKEPSIYVSMYPSVHLFFDLFFVCLLFNKYKFLCDCGNQRKERKAKQSQAKPRKKMNGRNESQSIKTKTKPNQTLYFLFFSFCSLHLSHPPTITSSQVTQIFSFDPDHLSQTDLCTFNICVKIT